MACSLSKSLRGARGCPMNDKQELSFPASKVFCNDALLSLFQLAPWRPYADSKTLVDLPLRVSPEEAISKFEDLGDSPTREQGLAYLDHVFENDFCTGPQCLPFVPVDYNDELPTFVADTKNVALREFARWLKKRWVSLSRRIPEARCEVEGTCTSLIVLPHPFFVPGGRFREMYYWDTLWMVRGLLLCDMRQSALNAVRNLLWLVRRFGFVPNGARIYYLNRTQPPVLSEAVAAIHDALPVAERAAWLREALPALEREYASYITCRRAMVEASEGPLSILAAYHVNTNTPRPESYAEDVETAGGVQNGRIFSDIASGAESGWDFSSRWLRDPSTGLRSIHTGNIIPTCLNAFLLRTERLLCSFHEKLADAGGTDETIKEHIYAAKQYAEQAHTRQRAMNELLWSKERRMWMDFDLSSNSHTATVSCAGLLPLWAGCWDGVWDFDDARLFVEQLMRLSGLVMSGGLAATAITSPQQWDAPNSWPPLADLVVQGLRGLEDAFPGCGAGDAAETIAMRTLRSMYNGWIADGEMHEKYDASVANGRSGKGGEYEPQEGFGWTNGVALTFMMQYRTQVENAVSGTWLS